MAFLLKNPIRHAGRVECCYLQLIGEPRLYSKTPSTDSTKSHDTTGSASPQEQQPIGEKRAEYQGEEDFVGPVCSRSNLRQVWYSTRFSSQSHVDQGGQKKNLRHPYSLEEFKSDPIQSPRPLSELKARLELEDLEWRFFRKRVDRFNQNFWESQSTRFEEYEAKVKAKVSESNHVIPVENNKELQEQLDRSLDEFYRSWLIQGKDVFMKYNWEWWRLQPALMKGGWKAQMRNLRWKLACWKYKFSFHN